MVKQKYFILTVQIVNEKPTKVVNTLVGIFVSLFLKKGFFYIACWKRLYVLKIGNYKRIVNTYVLEIIESI